MTAIRAITQRMQDINYYTTEVAGSVEQQEAATGEISHNVASAASGAKSIVQALDEIGQQPDADAQFGADHADSIRAGRRCH